MEPRHGCKLEDLCRICGCKLFIDRKQAKVKKSYPCTYQCSSYTEEILQAFHIDTKKDSPEIHPQKLCNKCYLSMKRATAAAQKKTPYKCSVEPYDWFIHSVERCKDCNGHKPFYTARWQKTGKLGSTPAEIVEHIRAVMPHRIIQSPTHPSLAPIQLLSAIEELQCPICFDVLQQLLLQDEIRALTKEEKQQLLHDAGITVDVQPIHELAMKSMLGIPCERKQHALCKELIGDNLEVELAPFSFKLPNGEEGLRGAAYGYTPNLTSKIVEQNEKEGKLTWHGGIIPNDQIWIKLGGDKGGGLFKMIFQILNTPKPNSVHNTCVFSCFEADDTVTNLHVALDRTYTLKLFLTGDIEFLSIMYGLSGASGKQPCLFCLITLDQLGMSVDRRGSCVPRSLDSIILDHQSFIEAGGNLKRAKWYNNCIHDPFFNIPLSQVFIPGLHITQGIFQKLFSLFERACHNLDLKLAMHWKASPMAKSQYDVYSQTLKDLDSALIELEQLNQEAESAVTPIVDELLELAGNCYKRVQVQEEKVKTLRETIQMGFNLKEGPCIKGIESCLTSFGVCHQRYYGGIFVESHVHKILKPANVDTLCSCVLKATENMPELKSKAVAVHQKFHTILMQFSKCHVLYDSTVLTQDDIQHLGSFFRLHDAGSNVPVNEVINPCAHDGERRNIFFLSDSPHLIKTTRNCWANPKRWVQRSVVGKLGHYVFGGHEATV
eukprot:Em0026g61a